jgi:hypothetical protein
MSNNFTNNLTQKVLNYRDTDLVIHELCDSIISQASPAPPLPPTYYQDFTKGLVIDNWGVDLYSDNNLQEKNNFDGIEYFVTYLIDENRSEQLDKCNWSVVYDFSFILTDCSDSAGSAKQRLTRIVDLFIESIVNNNIRLESQVGTAVDTTNPKPTIAELESYKIPLRASKLLNRTSNISESINTKNYLTANISIKFLISKQ